MLNKGQDFERIGSLDHLHGKVTVSIDYGKAVVWLDEGGAGPISWDCDTSSRCMEKLPSSDCVRRWGARRMVSDMIKTCITPSHTARGEDHT